MSKISRPGLSWVPWVLSGAVRRTQRETVTLILWRFLHYFICCRCYTDSLKVITP